MSYNPARPAEILANLCEAYLTAAGQAVGEFRVIALAKAGALKVVDNLDLKYADDAYARARLARDGITNPSEWTVIAVVDRDETYFDSCDGKWEYCYTDYAVVVPNTVLADDLSTPTEWEHAVKGGYGEYA